MLQFWHPLVFALWGLSAELTRGHAGFDHRLCRRSLFNMTTRQERLNEPHALILGQDWSIFSNTQCGECSCPLTGILHSHLYLFRNCSLFIHGKALLRTIVCVYSFKWGGKRFGGRGVKSHIMKCKCKFEHNLDGIDPPPHHPMYK